MDNAIFEYSKFYPGILFNHTKEEGYGLLGYKALVTPLDL
jgi:hypothetical protein